MLITEDYRELNRLLHESNPNYGVSGQRYVEAVRQLIENYGTREVLDYGCGKRTLEKALGFPITNYDPCIPGLDAPPAPHNIVACTDVLEHIEPLCVEGVLKDLRRVTRKVAFLVIATRPAGKFLADGRNAHLIIEPEAWWVPKIIDAGFLVRLVSPGQGEFVVFAEPETVVGWMVHFGRRLALKLTGGPRRRPPR